jgi:4-methylaminobutanoate oxidase (formaldehyde-forming)
MTRPDGIADAQWVESATYSVDLAGERYAATVSLAPPYDPAGARVRA